MVVKGKVNYKGSNEWVSFRMTRKDFISEIKQPSFSKNVDMLIVDVCLTKWIYDSVYGWWSAPRIRYVPNEPDKWRLSEAEIITRLKYSPKGFTQR